MTTYSIDHLRKSRYCNYVAFRLRLDNGKVIHGTYDLDEANVILCDWWRIGDYNIAKALYESISDEMRAINEQTKQAIYRHFANHQSLSCAC